MNTSDARVRYTRMVIKREFLALLQEKPVGRITVKELCERCEINRATFYKHYQDPFDLLEKMEEELLDSLKKGLAEQNFANCGLKEFFAEILKDMKEHGSMYLVIGSENGDSSFGAKVFVTCYREVFSRTEGWGMSKEEQELLYHFISAGCSGLMSYWFKNGMEEPAELVAGVMEKAIRAVGDAFRTYEK